MSALVLLFQSRDCQGIVARVSDFINRCGGNITAAHQHTTDPRGGFFFMRVAVSFETDTPADKLAALFAPIAEEYAADARFFDSASVARMGIFVSKPGHCLIDLLHRVRSGDLRVHIPFVASNHESHRDLVEQFGVPFFYVPACASDSQEEALLAHARKCDFLVLARYMRVLSTDFLARFGRDIINIHHGFLPSFKGAYPYRQALEKGVKVIGATAHFADEHLDEGPIIAQSVSRVSHEDDEAALMRKGRLLEQEALAEAVYKYLDHRIIRHQGRTIVF
jgi:formyltetrahydrofolate deformylase